MKFALLLTASILCTTPVIAIHHLRAGSTLARNGLSRRLPRSSQLAENDVTSNGTQPTYTSNWSGAVHKSPPPGDAFRGASAQFVVPEPRVPAGGSNSSYSTSVWVGIDGPTYQAAILQAGLDLNVDSNGTVSYACWYEWYPEINFLFSGITVKAGDTVSIAVTASSASAGVATIQNHSNGQKVSQNVTAPDPSNNLGGQNVEWIVEDYYHDGVVPLANFGEVKFTNTSYTTTHGASGGTRGANLYDMRQKGRILTDSKIVSDSEVDVTHL